VAHSFENRFEFGSEHGAKFYVADFMRPALKVSKVPMFWIEAPTRTRSVMPLAWRWRDMNGWWFFYPSDAEQAVANDLGFCLKLSRIA
jgi:hypothetical protein